MTAPAFYALRPGGWRDYVTLLHPPYTLWHLSYVAAGAAAAPHFHLNRMLWALAAFALALGVAAHALDELQGRPLRTQIPSRTLVALALVTLAGAVAIGVAAAATWGWWLLAFVGAGAVLVPAYNLEWFGGAVHTNLGFALAWGAFPALTGFFVEAQRITLAGVAVALYATLLSAAQRVLSTPVREARRTRNTTQGIERLELALRALTVTSILVAVVLVTARLTWAA